MRFESTRFGVIEVAEDEIVHFCHGIPGFETCRKYVLMQGDGRSPFRFLQSLDDPHLTFVVTDPLWFRPDYRVGVRQADLDKIGVTAGDQVAVYVVVTVPSKPQEMTANLLAPILINTRTREAIQHVQSDGGYQTRHRILDELARCEKLPKTGIPAGTGVPLQQVS